MSTLVKKNTTVFVVDEAVEGTYDAASAGSEAIQPLADGLELIPARETLERSNMSGSIGMATPRAGMRSSTATIPCEFRAGDTSGEAPDYDLLMQGALGASRSVSSVTSTTGHSASSINMSAENASGYTIGDIVVIKESEAYHCSPVTAVNETSINLLVSATGAFSDEVVIEASEVYYPADSGHPSLTVEIWLESVRKEYGSGMKVTNMSLNNFSTGVLADLSFSLEGSGYSQSIGTLGVTAAFEDSLPPVILSACLYQDGVAIAVNDFSLSVENSLGWVTSTCSANGRISSRVTNRKVSGSFSPYKDGTSVANFTKFDNSTSFSIFVHAYNPATTSGEFDQVVGFYLPDVKINELGAADKDGVVQESINFSASRGNSNDTDEIFFGSI